MATGRTYNRFLNGIIWQKAAPAAFAIYNNDVHTWRISVSGLLPLYDQFLTILSTDEVKRANLFYFQKHRDRFVIRRGMQRCILGQYLNLPPAQVQFALGPNNKPYIANKGATIKYNISHAKDHALLSVSLSDIGCDVEYIDDQFKYNDIMPDHFSAAEAAFVEAGNQAERFFTLWTRKEAILKATGLGLGEHLSYTPALDGRRDMHPNIAGSQYNWEVSSFLVNEAYVGTVATPITNPNLVFWQVDDDLAGLNG